MSVLIVQGFLVDGIDFPAGELQVLRVEAVAKMMFEVAKVCWVRSRIKASKLALLPRPVFIEINKYV